MVRRETILTALKNTAGASFIYVLGVILLLLALGGSVLTAAVANIGFYHKQREHSAVMLLGDSVHRSIMYSLLHDTADEGLLSARLVRALIEAGERGETLGPLVLDTLTISGAGISSDLMRDTGGNAHIESVTLTFPESACHVSIDNTPYYIPARYDEEGNEISPEETLWLKTASVNVMLAVDIEIRAGGKLSATRAIYNYTKGELSDGMSGGALYFVNSGEWELVSHEKIEARIS